MRESAARARMAPETEPTEMPRGTLIGVRFSSEEKARLDALARHLEATHPGVVFNAQMAIKAAIAIVSRDAGLEAPPPAPSSRPHTKKTRAPKR
jgi:hypothetical protein